MRGIVLLTIGGFLCLVAGFVSGAITENSPSRCSYKPSDLPDDVTASAPVSFYSSIGGGRGVWVAIWPTEKTK